MAVEYLHRRSTTRLDTVAVPYYEVAVRQRANPAFNGVPNPIPFTNEPALPPGIRSGRGYRFGTSTYIWWTDTAVAGLTPLTREQTAVLGTTKAGLRNIEDVLTMIQSWSLGRETIPGARTESTEIRVRNASLRAQIEGRR